MRFAYADPPYPGCSHLYRGHESYAGEVDLHALVARLEGYDGWALSTNATSLGAVFSLAPHSRVLAWTKTNAAFKPGSRLIHAWEPVLVSWKHGRSRTAPIVADWCSSKIVQKNHNHTKGSKPREFCFWLFDALGLEDGDEFDDLFPGSGAVTLYLEEWRRQMRMPTSEFRRIRHPLPGQKEMAT